MQGVGVGEGVRGACVHAGCGYEWVWGRVQGHV